MGLEEELKEERVEKLDELVTQVVAQWWPNGGSIVAQVRPNCSPHEAQVRPK